VSRGSGLGVRVGLSLLVLLLKKPAMLSSEPAH
jgi:hypothetical protein